MKIEDIPELTSRDQAMIAAEVAHDINNQVDGALRVRWTNRCVVMMLKRITSLEKQLKALTKEKPTETPHSPEDNQSRDGQERQHNQPAQ
jgi:hypothetical protein